MKKLLLILLLIPVVVWGQIEWGAIPWVQPNTHWVTPDKGASIQATVTAAKAGDEIFLNPGTYTESVVVDKALTFTSTGENDTSVVWQNDSLVFTLGVDGVVFNGIYFKALRDGQLADVGTYDWRANDCSFDDSTWTFAKDDAVFVHWRDVHLYPRKMGGTGMTNGTVYTEERFISGVPVGEPVGPYYGLVFTSGIFHAEDKINVYAHTDTVYACLDLTGDAALALQGGALIGVQGGNDLSVAVRMRSSSTFLCNGGDIQNNSDSPDTCALSIWGGTAVATIQHMRIKNNGTGGAYKSDGGASTFMNVNFTGAITPSNTDIIQWTDGGNTSQFIYTPNDLAGNPDSLVILQNLSGYDYSITRIFALADADDDSFEVGIKSLTGAAVAAIVLDDILINIDGANGTTFFRQVTSTNMDNTTLPNSFGLYIRPIGVGASNTQSSTYWSIYVEWTVDN